MLSIGVVEGNTSQSHLLSQQQSVREVHKSELVSTLHAGNSLYKTISGYIPINTISYFLIDYYALDCKLQQARCMMEMDFIIKPFSFRAIFFHQFTPSSRH